jgi:hypothetical protein
VYTLFPRVFGGITVVTLVFGGITVVTLGFGGVADVTTSAPPAAQENMGTARMIANRVMVDKIFRFISELHLVSFVRLLACNRIITSLNENTMKMSKVLKFYLNMMISVTARSFPPAG